MRIIITIIALRGIIKKYGLPTAPAGALVIARYNSAFGALGELGCLL